MAKHSSSISGIRTPITAAFSSHSGRERQGMRDEGRGMRPGERRFLSSLVPHPSSLVSLDRWALDQRGPKNRLDPWRPSAFMVEPERSEAGELVDVATLFLTNRECPYRCLMCDLWKNTLDERVPVGAIPAQIRYALE